MPILDFREIPQANVADGNQDTFELLARDFFEMLGFTILSGPDRGQDGGRDLIILEKRNGIIGTSEIPWLVSCKHKAHSGQAVNDGDEVDITDRLKAHSAKGFIGFYSTIISSPLARKFEALKSEFEVKIFDRERIESQLLDTSFGMNIVKRYFPKSYELLNQSNYKPANLFSKYEPLECKFCGKDLLSDQSGIIVFVQNLNHEGYCKYEAVFWVCKGKCDRAISREYEKLPRHITSWEDISDIVIPSKYLSWNIAILNRIRDGFDKYADTAFSDLKQFIIRVSQLVLRNQSKEQINRLIELSSIPDYI